MSGWLIPELERILGRARAEQRGADAAARYRRTLHQVEGYLAAHPDASANRVHREIGGRRQDVLRAVRSVKERFPGSRNRPGEGMGE